MKALAIKDVAQRTGIAAGTIRMWEQRYGFPEPERTPAGYRLYSDEDVTALQRVLALRETGLSVPAAVERARAAGGATDRPSLFGALATGEVPVQARRLSKPTLLAISRAIEDETMARAAGPVVIGAFQHERNYRVVERRYRELARTADAVLVFADFTDLLQQPGEPIEIPLAADDALGNEWAVVVDAPGYSACLLAWEPPESQQRDDDADRCFEAMWTLDPRAVRRAAVVGGRLAGRADPALGERMEALLAERPLASEQPSAGLTALTNRMIDYMEAGS